MESQSFKRVVAKFAVQQIVWSATASATAAAVHSVVDVEDDSLENEAIDFGALVAGFAVSRKLRPVTDQVVDRIADWRISRKQTNDIEGTATEVK